MNLSLPLSHNSRCAKLGHTFSAAKYYAHNRLYLRHCKRCPAVLTGAVEILDPKHLAVKLNEFSSMKESMNATTTYTSSKDRLETRADSVEGGNSHVELDGQDENSGTSTE